MNGPVTLGIWRYSGNTHPYTYAFYRNGVLVVQNEIEQTAGDKTTLDILQGTETYVYVTAVRWYTTKGGTLLFTDPCNDLGIGWTGNFADPMESSHSGWSDAVTDDAPPGQYRAHDGSGGGKDIIFDEPDGTEYVEIDLEWEEGEVWVGLGLHTIGEANHTYDNEQLGGFGVMELNDPYNMYFPFATNPADPPDVPQDTRPLFRYNPPIEALREYLQ